jgi:hypothetical protein
LMMGMDQNMWKLKTFVFTYKKNCEDWTHTKSHLII